MPEKRFYYSNSLIYGWAVYDRHTHTPAYDACCELLPPVKIDESGATMESPILLENEYKVMRLCLKLNAAERRLRNELSILWRHRA